jgi:hypothetical protein
VYHRFPSSIGSTTIRVVYPPIEMREMPFWKLIENSPEWVTVFGTFLFAGITAVIIWRQKCVMEHQATIMQQQKEVMEKQGEISARHEQMQNRLLQLQHEHEWLTALNAKREEILRTSTGLHIGVLTIIRNIGVGQDEQVWSDVLKLRSELKLQMEILDVAAYTGDKGGWYAKLDAWCSEVFRIIGEHFKSGCAGAPTDVTRKALQAAEKSDPVAPIFELRTLIKKSTEEFNKKWAAESTKV